MLHFTKFSEQSITKLLEESKLLDSKTKISEITSVHIRSTEKRSYEKVLPARQFFKALRYVCLVRKHLCSSKVTWVATDDNRNWFDFDSEIEHDNSSLGDFKTFGLNVSEKAARYSPLSLLQFFAEVSVISNARLTIGTMFSNLLVYTYEMKAVDDPHASDRTQSLGYSYFPFIRTRGNTFLIISPNFLYLAETNPALWPQKLEINDSQVLASFVHTRGWAPVLHRGLLEVAFVNRTVYNGFFFTPYFNLQRHTETSMS
ncbi:uncharacterized protein LOC142350647 [Convolutriloba macropyga]|uniref:uncharacterized protein LOC142350647 n=1 Tax=Convolutriloba macropyga TaxID=536237 RepID=UPI003F5229FD